MASPAVTTSLQALETCTGVRHAQVGVQRGGESEGRLALVRDAKLHLEARPADARGEHETERARPERFGVRRVFECEGHVRALPRFACATEAPGLRARETVLRERAAIAELRKDDGDAAADRPPGLERTALAQVQAFFPARRYPRDELGTLQRRDRARAVAAAPANCWQSVEFDKFAHGPSTGSGRTDHAPSAGRNPSIDR